MEFESENKRNIAFIVELFTMLCILLVVIVVITETLVMTRGRSSNAKHLTEAVIVAEDTMEVIEAAEGGGNGAKAGSSLKAAADILSGKENISAVKAEADKMDFDIVFSDSGEGAGEYSVSAERSTEKGKKGKLTSYVVTVSLKGGNNALYSLRSGKYYRRKKA